MKCPNCASANPTQARFCLNCGTNLSTHQQSAPPAPAAHTRPNPTNEYSPANSEPLTAKRPASERRLVTALFADVVDSTALAEQLDPEEWTEIMNRAFERMAPVISRYGGVITRLMGDAMLAFFGAPQAHEDDPLRAAHASLALLESVREYGEEVRRAYRINFAIRIGLNTGTAVVGEVGSALVHEYTAMGDAVNLAARMQAAARPMSAWITENTYRYIAYAFDCIDLGRIAVKGKTEPVQVYELGKPKTQADQQRGTHDRRSPLVGRKAELAGLLAAASKLVGSTAGPQKGQAVLLVGEAGIGKSRLITEWQAAVRQDASLANLKWATGRCLSYTQSQPYQLLISLLYSLLEPPEAFDQPLIQSGLAPVLQDELGPNGADAALYLEDLMSAAPAGRQDGYQISLHDPQELQMLYLSAVRQLLRAIAQRQPTIIILEDIQWADPSSVELLARLIPLALELPILFCCVTRPETSAPGWRLFETITHQFAANQAEDRLTQISLTSLGEADTEELAANLLALQTLPAKIQAVLEKSGGNPLFVEELIRWAVAVPASESQASKSSNPANLAQDRPVLSSLPDTLQGLLLARIDRLEPPARHILLVAAVIGRRFSASLLVHILQNTGALADRPDDLATVLAQLETNGFIERLSSPPALSYQFHHALVQQAAYQTLLKTDQRRLHLAAGQALEELFHDQLEANSAMLAYHFGRAGESERAVHYYSMAAHSAMRRYALPEAIIHFSNALELVEQDQWAQSGTAASLYLQRGAAREKLGDFEAARRDLEAALQAGQANQDVATELEALLNLGLLWAARDYNQTGGYYQQALQLARQEGRQHELAASLNRVGNWYANLEQPADGIPLHQEALAIYQELNDEHGIADTLDLLGMTHGLGGDLHTSVEYFTQAVQRYRQLDDRHGLSSSLTSLGMRGAYYEGSTMVTPIKRLTDARAEVDEGLEIARSIGWQSGQAYALLLLTQIASSVGDYSQGIEYGHKALQIATELDHLQWLSGINAVLGIIYSDLFSRSPALAHLEQAFAQGKESGSLNWIRIAAGYLASELIAAGQSGRAEQLLDSILEDGMPARTVGQRVSWCAQAELALVRKDWRKAFTVIQRLLSDARVLDGGRAGVRVTFLHGQALLLSGDLSRAEQEFIVLRTQSELLGAPTLIWRANACLATVYAAQGNREDADQAASLSAVMIDQIAANLTDSQLRADFLTGAQAWLKDVST